MPSSHKSNPKNKCLAVDRWGVKCVRERAEGEERWCSLHVAEQSGLYKDYKRCTEALLHLPQIEQCTNRQAITKCELVELKECQNRLRRRFVLLNRAIDARLYHHEHFYAENADFGHMKFIQGLKRDKKLCELAIAEIEKRAHVLILQQTNMSFLLEDREHFPKPSKDFECRPSKPEPKKNHSSPKKPTKMQTPAPSQRLATEDEVDNPLDAAYNQRRDDLLTILKYYIHVACGYKDRLLAHERKLIIEAVIRDVIIRDPALALAAQGWSHVSLFIQSDKLAVENLARLVKALYLRKSGFQTTLGVRENFLRNAVQNVLFRKPEDVPEDEKTWFLGGWVYKNPLKEDLPLRGWDHLHAFIGCSDCLMGCIRSLDELLLVRKHSVSPYGKARYSRWIDSKNTVDQVLAALGILVGDINPINKRNVFTIKDARDEVWTEKQERAWMFMKLPRQEAWVCEFTKGLLNCDSLDVLIHDTKTDFVYSMHPHVEGENPKVWVTRHRDAPTQAGLADAQWSNDIDFSRENFKSAKTPEKRWNIRFSDDLLEIYVFDTPIWSQERTMNDFKWTLASAALKAHGYDAEAWTIIFDDLARDAAGEEQKWRSTVDASSLDLSWKCDHSASSEKLENGDLYAQQCMAYLFWDFD